MKNFLILIGYFATLTALGGFATWYATNYSNFTEGGAAGNGMLLLIGAIFTFFSPQIFTEAFNKN